MIARMPRCDPSVHEPPTTAQRAAAMPQWLPAKYKMISFCNYQSFNKSLFPI
jgi:hypothetical protein